MPRTTTSDMSNWRHDLRNHRPRLARAREADHDDGIRHLCEHLTATRHVHSRRRPASGMAGFTCALVLNVTRAQARAYRSTEGGLCGMPKRSHPLGLHRRTLGAEGRIGTPRPLAIAATRRRGSKCSAGRAAAPAPSGTAPAKREPVADVAAFDALELGGRYRALGKRVDLPLAFMSMNYTTAHRLLVLQAPLVLKPASENRGSPWDRARAGRGGPASAFTSASSTAPSATIAMSVSGRARTKQSNA